MDTIFTVGQSENTYHCQKIEYNKLIIKIHFLKYENINILF